MTEEITVVDETCLKRTIIEEYFIQKEDLLAKKESLESQLAKVNEQLALFEGS